MKVYVYEDDATGRIIFHQKKECYGINGIFLGEHNLPIKKEGEYEDPNFNTRCSKCHKIKEFAYKTLINKNLMCDCDKPKKVVVKEILITEDKCCNSTEPEYKYYTVKLFKDAKNIKCTYEIEEDE